MFSLKDELIVVKSEYEKLVGIHGVLADVVIEDGKNTYGVIFEDNMYGHDLGGKCEFGKGWYFTEDEIELFNKSKLCRMIEKNEELMNVLKEGGHPNLGTGAYSVRKNGALIFLTCESRKVFVFKDGATKPLIINITCDDDKIVVLHLMELMRIMPMVGILECYPLSGNM